MLNKNNFEIARLCPKPGGSKLCIGRHSGYTGAERQRRTDMRSEGQQRRDQNFDPFILSREGGTQDRQGPVGRL